MLKKLALTFSIIAISLGILLSPAHAANNDTSSHFPVKINNATGIKNVYMTIIAKRDGLTCIMDIDQQGYGTCRRVCSKDLTKKCELTDGTKLDPYTRSLSSLPSTLMLPLVASGRIYFSIGKPMQFYIDGNTGTIPDPDGFKTRDVNYYTLYDKIEFSYNPNGLWVNPTAVDFFALPIRLMLELNKGDTQYSGFYQTRLAILKAVHNVFRDASLRDPSTSATWNTLWLKYTGPSHDPQCTPTGINSSTPFTLLRLMSPGKAIATSNPLNTNTSFDPNYLESTQANDINYLDKIWEYYKNNTLTIDITELKGKKEAPVYSAYFFKGQVKAGTDRSGNPVDKFIFTNGNKTQDVELTKPKTISFFAGALDSFDAQNNTAKAIIVRQLTSAFTVGLLPALKLPNTTELLLDKTYFVTQKNKGLYFQNNSILTPTAGSSGPWYDLYSKALHSLGMPIYTFAYDDALGQDGTLTTAANNIKLLTITLGSLEGSCIPAPSRDDNAYTVRFITGKGKDITLTLTTRTSSGEKQTKTLIVSSSKQPVLGNILMPIKAKFDNTEYNIYLKYPMVTPQQDGIVTTKTGDKQYTVTFPG